MARGVNVWERVEGTAITTLTVVGVAGVLWGLWFAQAALMLTILGVLLAVALDRPVRWLERHGLPRGAGIAAVVVGLVVVLAAIVLLFAPPALEQLQALADSGPSLLQRLEHSSAAQVLARHVDLSAVAAHLRERAPSLASALVGEAVAVATFVGGGIAALVTLVFVVVFMLASGGQLVRSALAKIRPEYRGAYVEVLQQLYRSLGAYIGGLFVLVLSNVLFSGVFLAALGVRYFLPLAVFAGLCSLVPYAGAILAGTVLSLVAWGTGGAWMALGTLAYFLVYQQLESHVLSPLVYRHALDLNPLVILLAALFLAELKGIPGAIVAVPLAATLQIVLRELFRLRRLRLGLPGPASGAQEAADGRAGERSAHAPTAGSPSRAHGGSRGSVTP